MFLILLLFAAVAFPQVISDSKSTPLPTFEFWNPVTWINPKFSSQAVLQILRDTRDSQGKAYEQLKKALLPANLLIGNIRTEFEAWAKESKKPQKPNASRRPSNKKQKTTT